jgi:AmmeMemoRadiSam system protein B
MELIRPEGNSGKFYPDDPELIKKMIIQWNDILDKNVTDQNIFKLAPKAIVAPHAGYVYSGFTANFAHRVLGSRHPKRIIVVGPSHHVYIRGISAGYYDAYETPFGLLKGDPDYLRELSDKFDFTFEEEAHYLEHSTETQFPFIKYYEPEAKVIELIYGNTDYLELADLFEYILRDKHNAIVVSTDLSHYFPQETANEKDNNCLVAFEYQNIELALEKCEACGKLGLIGIIKTAKDLYLKTKVLDYRTSGDITGDKSAVVGYMSGVVYE